MMDTKPIAMQIPRVRIQTEDFDASAEIAALHAQDGRVGAVCSFIGVVRSKHAVSGAVAGALSSAADDISAMELEHYPGMTERSIEAMIDAAHARFDIVGARVVHRVGLLRALDKIVLGAVTSAHRGQSYQACEFLMYYIKTQAPFWKK